MTRRARRCRCKCVVKTFSSRNCQNPALSCVGGRMGFSSRAGLGEKWVGRKQRGFSQGICRLCGKARFPVVGLLMICPHRSACAVRPRRGCAVWSHRLLICSFLPPSWDCPGYFASNLSGVESIPYCVMNH